MTAEIPKYHILWLLNCEVLKSAIKEYVLLYAQNLILRAYAVFSDTHISLFMHFACRLFGAHLNLPI